MPLFCLSVLGVDPAIRLSIEPACSSQGAVATPATGTVTRSAWHCSIRYVPIAKDTQGSYETSQSNCRPPQADHSKWRIRMLLACDTPSFAAKPSGWDHELSEPKRAFIVPAKCEAAARHKKTRLSILDFLGIQLMRKNKAASRQPLNQAPLSPPYSRCPSASNRSRSCS